MSYYLRLATKDDELEVKQLYKDHPEEVKQHNLYRHIASFFIYPKNIEVYVWIFEDKIVACFSFIIRGETCTMRSGLCHKDHRGKNFMKHIYYLLKDRIPQTNCTTFYFKYNVGASFGKPTKRIAEGYKMKTSDSGYNIFSINVDKIGDI